MGIVAKTFEELEVWQLADQLRQHVVEITDSGPVVRDFKFRSQIREAADSVCDNTAEGFGRYDHPEFARFLVIAHGSLKEVKSKLVGGSHRRYFTVEQCRIGQTQADRTRRALLGLLRYLRSTDAPQPFPKRPKTRGE
jgi:four helix bundle protein